MAEAPSFTGEVRMLIDGKLVEADSGKRFENINPANEEVLGEVADASATDMRRAIAAARRAFDETDWSTNRALRKRCLEQLQEALEAEREELREELIAEVGAPHGDVQPAARRPARGRPALPGEDDRGVPVGARPARRRGLRHEQPTPGLEGADGCRRRDRAVELPVRGDDRQDRPDPRHREHNRAQAGARHALERHSARSPRRREDRHPAGCVQRGDVIRPPRR